MKIGDVVQDFELLDQNGAQRSLGEFVANGPVVIFFYPLASSGGCTKEACHFRDLEHEFARAGASVLGISRDSVDKQNDFSSHNGFGYPLLSDVDGTVTEEFGVRRKLLAKVLPVKRSTFIIDKDFVLRHVVNSETDMGVHADEALRAVAAL